MNSETGVRRALMLAGGGVKVAYQAGVLEVWLDEAGLTFDLADGASGGVFNLAMWAQGMSGRKIADNWRNFDPRIGVDLNWSEYARLFNGESMFELDAYRKEVFPRWGLDFEKIRASSREATFNAYNFSRHRLEAFTSDQMTEDHLVACVSLPMWFPPVVIDGDTYIDSVFLTDCNLEEAIRRGADELWVIWTVSDRGEWNDGFVANYFQIIEAVAVGNLKRTLARIEASNLAIERGGAGEFGRPVTVRMISGEVPLHYLINFSQDRLGEAVNLGVRDARDWCHDQGIRLDSPPGYRSVAQRAEARLWFTEEMKGFFTLGEKDPEEGFQSGRRNRNRLSFRLTIRVDGVDRFLADPDHPATTEGRILCDALGGDLPVKDGIFNLFVHARDPRRKQMLYRLFFTGGDGEELTLSGVKRIENDPDFDAWEDTTTLYCRVFQGRVGPDDEAEANVVGAGIVRIHLLDFLKQLTTFRVEGTSLAGRTAALARFGQSFFGKLWDVYATRVLSSGPI